MPVRWDADKDRFMFLFLFTDANIAKEKCQDIINAWPAHFGDKPTIRSIQEHVVKLKSQLKSETGISVGPSVGSKSSVKTKPEPGVKREPKAEAPMTPVSNRKPPKTKQPPKKRPRSDDSDDSDAGETPSKVKEEKSSDDMFTISPPRFLPSRKTKTGAAQKRYVDDALDDSDSDSSDDAESGVAGDEYHPELGAE